MDNLLKELFSDDPDYLSRHADVVEEVRKEIAEDDNSDLSLSQFSMSELK